jgi:hypothetical protein
MSGARPDGQGKGSADAGAGANAARIPVTLVTGPSARLREAAIAGALDLPHSGGGLRAAVILEGLPDGSAILEASDKLLITRIAPGCLCCAGNLVMRVTLNRLLRQRPERLFIGVADGTHLDQLRSWLSSAPYDQLLALTSDLDS